MSPDCARGDHNACTLHACDCYCHTPYLAVSKNCNRGQHGQCMGRGCDCWCHRTGRPQQPIQLPSAVLAGDLLGYPRDDGRLDDPEWCST
jgi:hypothetical protein